MFRIMFLAKTLHKTWNREIINETCTLTKDVGSFRFPEFLGQKIFYFQELKMYILVILAAQNGVWGVGGLIALILPLPMSL